MNVALARRAATETPLDKHCPAYRKALDECQRAMESGTDAEVERAWADAKLAAVAFWQGVAFGMGEGR